MKMWLNSFFQRQGSSRRRGPERYDKSLSDLP